MPSSSRNTTSAERLTSSFRRFVRRVHLTSRLRLHANAQAHDLAASGHGREHPGNGFRIALHYILQQDARLVADTARPAGRISTLAFLKDHWVLHCKCMSEAPPPQRYLAAERKKPGAGFRPG